MTNRKLCVYFKSDLPLIYLKCTRDSFHRAIRVRLLFLVFGTHNIQFETISINFRMCLLFAKTAAALK